MRIAQNLWPFRTCLTTWAVASSLSTHKRTRLGSRRRGSLLAFSSWVRVTISYPRRLWFRQWLRAWVATEKESNVVGCLAIFFFLGAFAKFRNATISFVASDRPHKTTWLPLDRFWLNLIFKVFSKICRGNINFIKFDKSNRCFIQRRFYIYNNISLNSS